jgi:endonuclease/exonuclease/phosphatase (EEP) superfamily protein YafD
MRGLLRNIHYNTVEDLAAAAKDLAKEQHRHQDAVKLLIGSAFGTEQQKGIFAARIEYYHSKPPINWAQELNTLTQLFFPEGEVMAGQQGLIACADQLLPIEVISF